MPKMQNRNRPKDRMGRIPIKKRARSIATLTGILIPVRLVANHFASELTMDAHEVPPYDPFVAGSLRESPWPPAEPACARGNEQ